MPGDAPPPAGASSTQEDRCRAPSDADFQSGSTAAKSAALRTGAAPPALAGTSSFPNSVPSSVQSRPHPHHSYHSSRPSSLWSSRVTAFLSVSGNDHGISGASAFPPLFFSAGANTTPETSLVGARGKSIPLDDSTAALRTSALRELNSNFPSPVFRHRCTNKSTSTQNTTYSQPVIVRTYSGPSPSPSTSTHHRRPSSAPGGRRSAGSRRIPLGSAGGWSSAGGGDKYAPGARGGSKASFFDMARSRVKKGLIPWPWAAGETDEDDDQPDDTKLPPIEAFSFNGFMADLQATTDIRADLDRIAEICARSHYSRSNQYDFHVAPHGSGSSFVQQPQRATGQRRGGSSTGGPTLQAVASDDENNARSQRRRRGGVGGGRRRSAAYGTLETIMSSSRSSEEDKTKKGSAAEIAAEVRGRAAKKAKEAAARVEAAKGEGEQDGEAGAGSGSGSRSSRGSRKGKKKMANPNEDAEDDNSALEPSAAVAVNSSQQPTVARRSRKPTAFAHAVIGSSRHQSSRLSRSSDAKCDPATPPSISPVALLSDPALPQTSDVLFDIPAAPDLTHRLGALKMGRKADIRHDPITSQTGSATSSAMETAVRIIGLDGVDPIAEGEEGAAPDATADTAVVSASFLTGLSSWLPWMPGAGMGVGQGQGSASHAEGTLRKLLKTVDAHSQSKGKAADDVD